MKVVKVVKKYSSTLCIKRIFNSKLAKQLFRILRRIAGVTKNAFFIFIFDYLITTGKTQEKGRNIEKM